MTYFSIVRLANGELSRFSRRGTDSCPPGKSDDGNFFKTSANNDSPEKSVGEDGADFEGLFSMVISVGQRPWPCGDWSACGNLGMDSIKRRGVESGSEEEGNSGVVSSGENSPWSVTEDELSLTSNSFA